MNRRWCTVPKLFNLRKLYEKKFADLCRTHDLKYVQREGYLLVNDWNLSRGVWDRGYKLMAVATFLAIIPISWFWWYRN